MKFNKTLMIIILSIISVSSYSQDPLYTQFYFNAIYTNPSLAGSNHNGTRFIANQRNQWHKIPGMLSTSSISVDMNFIRESNIGLFFYEDYEGEQFLSQSGGYLNLSGFLNLSRTISFRYGTKIGFYQKKINWDKFVFYDQLDPFYGNIASSNIPVASSFSTEPIFDWTIGGAIFYAPKKGGKDGIHMIGAITEHVVTFKETFYDNEYKIPLIVSFHYNSLIPTKSNSDILYNPYFRWTFDIAKPTDIKPIESKNQFQNIDLGLNLFVGSLTFGMGGKFAFYERTSKNINHGVLLIGWTNYAKNFMVSYSHDFPISGVPTSTVTTSELNLILFINGNIFPRIGVFKKYGGSNKCEDFYRRGKTVVIW
ncbi:MAG: PorP/SprF family type IX secretion system membrane protein [Bacteroidetes bacterium]|nr:PorP/SprF family type IX secretion system membrane protein [Bacteroidota bacterium]MBT5530327.1 PorP/SprF family type IX secretion system membrane protein [Cytophagia bacterium]MBT4338730.1 PorP/SprF family type IX secretion system membrane protein [Bacteroidota bacterium]MBT5990002.1 PorP/SprF family type IX secretion system membrane protein [Bacteroidota bacterium]MBT6837403.1 PorP/SprF family type IX secretion system membrane protein [Bacteroidota bacterium]